MWHTWYSAVCENCQDKCEFGGNSQAAGLVAARQAGWQAQAVQWIWGGVEIAWEFYCPTHRKDLG